MLAHASEVMAAGDLARAEKALHVALMLAKEAGPEEARRLLPLTLYHLSLLRKKQKQDDEAQKFRELASHVVDTGAAEGAQAPFAQLMANVLMNLGEYRRGNTNSMRAAPAAGRCSLNSRSAPVRTRWRSERSWNSSAGLGIW